METKSAIGGLVIGVTLGVVTGLLFAPQSGEKTRKRLLRKSLRIKNNATEYVDGAIDTLRVQLNKKIDQLALKGKETISQVSEKIKV